METVAEQKTFSENGCRYCHSESANRKQRRLQLFFIANPLDRYTLSQRDALKENADGSVDLYIQHDSPGPDKEGNWLPAPAAGKFVLMLRLYWPNEKSPSILNGTWEPPAVTQVQATTEAAETIPTRFGLDNKLFDFAHAKAAFGLVPRRLTGKLFCKNCVRQRFQRVADQISYRLSNRSHAGIRGSGSIE
jgi:hypothetical protein